MGRGQRFWLCWRALRGFRVQDQSQFKTQNQQSNNPKTQNQKSKIEKSKIQNPKSKITARSILLGFSGAIFVSAMQVPGKVVDQRAMFPFHSVMTLFPAVICLLFVLAILNTFLKRRFPKIAFTPVEFAVIYGISTVAAAIAAQDEVQFLLPMWVYPFRASQKDNMVAFQQYIPDCIFINLGINDKLKHLSVGNVLLKEIDISKTPNIEKLNIWSNYLQTIYVKNEKQINPAVLAAYKSKGEIKIIPPTEWQVTNNKGNVEYKICK